MKRRAIRFSAMIVVLALLLSTAAFAAMDASHYLSYYNAYITRSGNTVKVYIDVVGTGVMDQIGATEIYLYERENSYSNWTLVQTYLYSDPAYASAMMVSNASFKYDYVSYSGNSSYQYMAYVTIYAEKNGGSDSRNYIAN
jgi:hypothetical protein